MLAVAASLDSRGEGVGSGGSQSSWLVLGVSSCGGEGVFNFFIG